MRSPFLGSRAASACPCQLVSKLMGIVSAARFLSLQDAHQLLVSELNMHIVTVLGMCSLETSGRSGSAETLKQVYVGPRKWSPSLGP
jgi:hypothetical protein